MKNARISVLSLTILILMPSYAQENNPAGLQTKMNVFERTVASFQ